MFCSEWEENLIKRYHYVEREFVKNHDGKQYNSACFANPDPTNGQCIFRSCTRIKHQPYDQRYFNVNWMGIKKINTIECITHSSGPIDLLRDTDKITFGEKEFIQETTLNHTLKQHQQDDIVVIMVSTKKTPNAKRFTHFTTEFVQDLFLKLWQQPNINAAHSKYVSDYAQHANKLYGKQVSLSRLLQEAKSIFISPDTLRIIYVSFYTKYTKHWVRRIRCGILIFPFRQMGVDGNKKYAKMLKLFDGNLKFDVDANVNVVVVGSTAFIVNSKIYPGSKETHENISELLIEPMIISLKTSDQFKELSYGIGIDHPDRDYAVGDTLIPIFIEKLKEESKSDVFVSDTGITYDLSTATAFVKFLSFY